MVGRRCDDIEAVDIEAGPEETDGHQGGDHDHRRHQQQRNPGLQT
jgi:hypothetical protein